MKTAMTVKEVEYNNVTMTACQDENGEILVSIKAYVRDSE